VEVHDQIADKRLLETRVFKDGLRVPKLSQCHEEKKSFFPFLAYLDVIRRTPQERGGKNHCKIVDVHLGQGLIGRIGHLLQEFDEVEDDLAIEIAQAGNELDGLDRVLGVLDRVRTIVPGRKTMS